MWRHMANMTASTSQPTSRVVLYRCAGRRAAPRAPRAPPPRITNTQREIWDDDEMADARGMIDPDDAQFIRVSDVPVWDPEKGPMEHRVGRTLLEEQKSDEISVVETAWWFHTPPGGWNVDQKVPVAEQEEADFPQPEHPEEEKPYRFPLALMEEGMEVDGVITDIWLYHGAQVDFLGEFDGLIPISQEEWPDVQDDLLPGTKVRVRVHKLCQLNLYRWPIQLELLDEKLAPLITAPDAYEAPANLAWAFDQGWSLEEVSKVLHRPYTRTPYLLEPDMASVADHIQREFGWDQPDINGYAEDWVERQVDTATDLDIMITAADLMGAE